MFEPTHYATDYSYNQCIKKPETEIEDEKYNLNYNVIIQLDMRISTENSVSVLSI